jgi:thioredoxin-related protein
MSAPAASGSTQSSFSHWIAWAALAASVALLAYAGVKWWNRPVVWTTDYAAAVQQAKAENKKILLNFTGSDWCVNCDILDKEVFSTPAFARYARSHYVLVFLDFPAQLKLPDNVVKQNSELEDKYKVINTPTIVLLDANEKQVGFEEGYNRKGMDVFLMRLDKDYPGAAQYVPDQKTPENATPMPGKSDDAKPVPAPAATATTGA